MERLTRLLLAAILFASAPMAAPLRAEDRSPNVVVLLADDLGYGETGMQGNEQIPTPRIDSIAAEGVRFSDGYVTASYCSASRAGLLTGRYPSRFGYDVNPVGRANLAAEAGLPEDEVAFAESLAGVGYRTGLVGKWHLGGHPSKHPMRRGFDEFFGFLHEGHFFVPGPPWDGVTTMLRRKNLPGGADGPRLREGSVIYSNHMGYDEPPYDDLNPILRGTDPVEEAEYLTDALTRESVAFIEANRDKPFFLMVSYNAVHSPLQGAARYMRDFEHLDVHRQIFAAMLANLDASVGAVLDALREHDLDRDTLVVFLSDNGGPTRELTSSNEPLRGGKGSLYEGGIRVPFAARWTGRIPAGRTYERPVVATDIAATSLAVAGAERPPDAPPLDGVDLMPYLTGAERGAPHEEIYWRMGEGKTALRSGDWKLIRPEADARFEVYNLAIDRGESRDLADREPAIRERLIRRWLAIDAEMADPRPRPEPPEDLPAEVERPF